MLVIKKIILILILVLLALPSINIIQFGIGGGFIKSSNAISALMGVFLVIFLIFSRWNRVKYQILPAFLIILVLYAQRSSFIAIVYSFQVISIILIPYFFAYFNRQIKLQSFFNFAIFIGLLNIFIALLSRVFDFQLTINQTTIINKYGFLYQPYLYSAYIGAGLIISSLVSKNKISYLYSSIFIVALFFSDARSIGLSFILLYFILIILNNPFNLIWVVLISTVSAFFVSGKMSLENLIYGLSGLDYSLVMRLNNITNYFEWVTDFRILFGGGFQAFYEFSRQYGGAGPVDNLYIRLISEIGIFGILLFVYINFISIRYSYRIFAFSNEIQIKHVNKTKIVLKIMAIVSCFLGIAFFMESQIVPRSGHMMYLIFVIFFFNINMENTKK